MDLIWTLIIYKEKFTSKQVKLEKMSKQLKQCICTADLHEMFPMATNNIHKKIISRIISSQSGKKTKQRDLGKIFLRF